ncbi:GH-E family nuclease [Pseudomonas sp. PSKL.D1]|uniref:GH-E family nuclease n=1 Tax=Pseudomonas sp. PSKL.D1 TaxID=3029060 RepID=UPI002380F576|nr:GH-E family nuclease [Pseudomonas sp. PSKL.D1]WDY56481.1 GH-E family nuclease [Pseudomonas sp. PSKL.D1]
MSEAARVGDSIEHTSAMTGLLAGLAIGAIGAALIVGTGGLAAVAFVGAGAALGAGIGQVIGGLDFFTSEAGKIFSGSSNVYINNLPAARAHLDTVGCDKHSGSPKNIAQGSNSVFINGMPAARVGDCTTCDGKISSGSANVFIGGGTATTDPIDPEVDEWLENTIFVVGIGCAIALAGPVVVAVGLVGAYLGGTVGNWAGGEIFGEESDGQKIFTLAGGLLGGSVAGRKVIGFERNNVFTSRGFGSNLGGVGVRPKVASDNPSAWSGFKYRRGTFRKGVREKVWENAKSPEGLVRDPLTKTIMNNSKPWDMGHKPGYEHWKHVRSAEARGLNRKEFLDEFNQVGHYRPELPSSNRSHRGELKSDLYLGP